MVNANRQPSPLELSEESANEVLQEIRDTMGTIFGYDEKNREVGITGKTHIYFTQFQIVIVCLYWLQVQ